MSLGPFCGALGCRDEAGLIIDHPEHGERVVCDACADGHEVIADLEVIRASTLDNSYLDSATKDRFERQYAGTSREKQALHGNFAAAQGLVYSNFSRETHVIPHANAVDRVDDEWRVYGYDSGYTAPRVVLELGKTSYDQLVVLDEFHKRESHIEDAVAWFEQNGKLKAPVHCDHDPAEIEELKQAGYPARKARKSRDEGIAEVRRRLEPDGNLPITATGRGSGSERSKTGCVGLLISDNCPNLIRELLGYKEEHVGKPRRSIIVSTRFATPVWAAVLAGKSLSNGKRSIGTGPTGAPRGK